MFCKVKFVLLGLLVVSFVFISDIAGTAPLNSPRMSNAPTKALSSVAKQASEPASQGSPNADKLNNVPVQVEPQKKPSPPLTDNASGNIALGDKASGDSNSVSIVTDDKSSGDSSADLKAAEKPKTASDLKQNNEYQNFVEHTVGHFIPMFGHELFQNVPTTFAPLDRVPVPVDYVIGPGDEVIVRIWGQLDFDYALFVDRNGNLYLPKIGNINVAGIRYQELQGYLKSAIGRVFRNFELNVTLGQLRSIQVFVVGQAKRPGTYTVSSLSSIINALFVSGGPSDKGSMRRIQLKRDNGVAVEFDLYDLLIKGDKSRDIRLMPGDVIFIPPVGKLAAIVGSVNVPAIYEMKDNTVLKDLVNFAGGFTTVASGQKVTVERIVERKSRSVEEWTLDNEGLSRNILDGDLVIVSPILSRFEDVVTITGNGAVPSRVPWREGMRIADLMVDKNSLIPNAYWERQNLGKMVPRYNSKEVNWDYAILQRLNPSDLKTRLLAFNLGKAIVRNSMENLLLQPGDIITIFSATEELPKTENDIGLKGNIFGSKTRRFAWREGVTVNDLIPDAKWLFDYYDYREQQNRTGELISGSSKKEINWDYAVIQRMNHTDLVTRLLPFNLGKAIGGNSIENLLLQPGDIITIFSATEVPPKTENDIGLQGSVFGTTIRRFAWREGMAISDLIPDAKWLIDYYDYWANLKGDGLRSELNWNYANLVRLQPDNLNKTMITFDLGKAIIQRESEHNIKLRSGDVITIFSKDEVPVPTAERNKFIHLDGEFVHAGVYKVEQGETLGQLITRAGGLTSNAYVYGAEFTRESTRIQQQKRMDEALNRLEGEFERTASGKAQNALTGEDVAGTKASVESQRLLINRMRDVKAIGRLVLELNDNEDLKKLPIGLEDGDRLYVPFIPSNINVIGAVYNETSFTYASEKRISDYLSLSGGITKDGDSSSTYVFKANGSVISKRSTNRLWGGFENKSLMPGDTIVVPEEMQKSTWAKELKDWTQILYQFGLGAAAIKILQN